MSNTDNTANEPIQTSSPTPQPWETKGGDGAGTVTNHNPQAPKQTPAKE